MIPERYEPASLLFILIVLIIWLNRDSKRNTTRGKSHKFKGLLPQIDNCIEVLNERLKQGNFVFVRGVELTVNCQNLANELGILDVAHPDLELDLDKDIVVAFWLDYLIGLRIFSKNQDLKGAKEFAAKKAVMLTP